MRAATHEITIFDFFEFVVGAQPKHLVKAMGEIEHRTVVDVLVFLPHLWRDDSLDLDVLAKVRQTRALLENIENFFPKTRRDLQQGRQRVKGIFAF